MQAYGEAIGAAVMMRKAEAEGEKRWGEKTPSYVFSIALLNGMFPDARFLFVVRDGRDVCLSLSQLAWGPNNAYGVARHWSRVFHEWKKISPGLGNRAMQVRYEDYLLEQPEDWVDRIGNWIGQDDFGRCLDGFRVKKGNSLKWRNKFFFFGHGTRCFQVRRRIRLDRTRVREGHTAAPSVVLEKGTLEVRRSLASDHQSKPAATRLR